MRNYFDYIIKSFRLIYDYDTGIRIVYGEPDGDIQINDSCSSFLNSVSPSPELICWKEWKGQCIPFLGSKDDTLPVLVTEKHRVVINYDIIGSAFFFLSGWQEFHSENRDSYGRFAYKDSFQSRHGITTIPVVNYYFDILKEALEAARDKELNRKLWPGSNLAVSLSHDIDKINSGWKEGAFSEFKKGRLISSLKVFLSKFYNKDVWNNLDDIIELEKNLGVPSTFFFLTKSGNGNSDYPFSQVIPYFESIKENASEVALHGSLGSAKNQKILANEIDTFKDSVLGNRFHFLMFDPKSYANTLEQTKLKYDSTLGFAEHIGFRNGFCFPFFPYNHTRKTAYNFLEIPLIIMDATLNDTAYMGNDPEKDSKLETLIDEVTKFNGLLTILWHNNYFSEFKYQGWRQRYIELVTTLKTKNAIFFTKKDIQKMVQPVNE